MRADEFEALRPLDVVPAWARRLMACAAIAILVLYPIW